MQSYVRLAARYPSSAYTDNALASRRAVRGPMGATGGDRIATGGPALQRLVSGFPTSSLVPAARKELKRLEW